MESSTRTSLPPSQSQPYKMTHPEYMIHLFESGFLSDCTVHCRGRVWNLHRTILASRCEFFRACFLGGFRESQPNIKNGRHTSTFSVRLDEDDTDALDRVLRWIYTLEYPRLMVHDDEPQDTTSLPDRFWTSELNLYLLADKYSLPDLTLEAYCSILDTAETVISDVDSIDHRSTFVEHLDDFVDMLEELFSNQTTQPSSQVNDEDEGNDEDLSEQSGDLPRELLSIVAPMVARYVGTKARLSDLMACLPIFAIMLVEELAEVRKVATSTRKATGFGVLGQPEKRSGTCQSPSLKPDIGGQSPLSSCRWSTSSGSVLSSDDDRGSVHSGKRSSSSSSSSSTSRERSRHMSYLRMSRRKKRAQKLMTTQKEGTINSVAAERKQTYIPMNEDSDTE